MPKSITIDHVQPVAITIAPAGAAAGGYRINIKYSLQDISNAEFYRKEVTYYNSLSGLTPVLPASFENLTNTYLNNIKGGLNTLEGL